MVDSNFLNSLYSYEAVQAQMKTQFLSQKPSVLLLPDFLNKSVFSTLNKEALSSKGKEVFVPHQFSYTLLDIPAMKTFFSSSSFIDFLRNVTGKKISKVNLEISQFAHGNFTLLHDDLNTKSRTEFFIFFGDAWNPEFGGTLCYTQADGSPLIFEPKPNSFGILSLPNEWMSFVRYVNHFAGKKSFILVRGSLS